MNENPVDVGTKQEQPSRRWKFPLLIILIPGAIAGLFYTGAFSVFKPNADLGDALAQAVVARIMIYIAYGVIVLGGLVGLIYTFIRARKNWRFYIISLALPLALGILLLGSYVYQTAQTAAYHSGPDYARYQANTKLCDDVKIIYTGSDDIVDSTLYSDTTPQALQDIITTLNKQSRALHDDVADTLYLKDTVCTFSEHMTEAQLVTLKSYISERAQLQAKYQKILPELSHQKLVVFLTTAKNIEDTKSAQAAYNYAIDDARVETTYIPNVTCTTTGSCYLKWVNQHTSEELTTTQMIAKFQ